MPKINALSPKSSNTANGAGSLQMSPCLAAACVRISITFCGGVPYATPTLMLRRTRELVSVQFVTRFSRNMEFGITVSTSSGLRTTDERVLISVTVPTMPSTSRTSPTRTLRSASTMMPLMKFLMSVCVPKPKPIARAPPKNAKTVSGILRIDSVEMASIRPTNIIAQLRSVRACASAIWPRATMVFWMRLAMKEAIQ